MFIVQSKYDGDIFVSQVKTKLEALASARNHGLLGVLNAVQVQDKVQALDRIRAAVKFALDMPTVLQSLVALGSGVPLVDARGRPGGWMSTVLDVSAQRRMEELSRQQQDKLQAAARLATMGEMATLLSHELNQPLAAIASYATGSLNLMPETPDDPPADLDTQLMIRQAVARIAGQREEYLVKALHDYKSGVRSGGAQAAMADVAYPLSDEEITALAHYLAHL